MVLQKIAFWDKFNIMILIGDEPNKEHILFNYRRIWNVRYIFNNIVKKLDIDIGNACNVLGH